jgi:chromosome condensin MukBEF MukE localization factor
MGNDNRSTQELALDFFRDPEAKHVFAKLDYALRDGMHLQRYSGQDEMFAFLEKHTDSLEEFYQCYYDVQLASGGESTEKYYFLDFPPQSRGNILLEHRYFLPNEYVIVGFLIYKIVFLDGYLELNSISTLQKIVRQDYEDLKPGIYRVLAKARREKSTQMDDEKVDKLIVDALEEFHKIGWVKLDGTAFDTLPAFHRLTKLYGDYINNLDNWLNQSMNENSSPNT